MMKKSILTTCFILFLLNVLSTQTANDLEAAITATDNRTLTLENDVVFDFSRYGTTFDDGGVLTLEGNVVDARNNNPSNAYTLTSSTGAFLEVFDTSTLNLTDIQISGNNSTGTNFITNNGTLNITNSIFSDNLNGQGSSVISNSGNLFVDGSLFESNSVALTDNNEHQLGRGGAIRNSGKALITNSTFRANGSQHGSAIYNTETGTMEVINSIFVNNFSTNGSNYSYGSIFNQGTLIVRDSIFQNNTMGAGGGIYNEGNATIYNSHFITNTATGLGGGINNGKLATLTIYDSTFDGNKGTGASAAINSAHGGNVNIIRSTIENHTVISEVDSGNWDRDNGGAMYFYGVEFLRDEDGALIVDKNGHAIVKTPTGHLYIEDSVFRNNTVSRGGGAIYSTGYATIIDTLFEGNSSDLKHGQVDPDTYNAGTAGAFYDYNYTDIPTTIKGSTFRDNSAYSAGAIYHPAGHLIIDTTLFEDNSAIAVGGGGALMNGGVGSLVLTNSRFIGNFAGLGGALSQMSENRVYIANTHFEKNTANAYGGALYLRPHRNSSTPENVKSYTEIVNSNFFQNSSNGSGGAIYLQSDLDLSGSTFTENTALGGAGGSMYILDPSVATIRDGVFLGNSAGNGGAISNAGTLEIYDSVFEKNSASSGSAIINNGELNIHNSIFKYNVSTYESSYNYATVTGTIDGNGITNIYNSSFLNNYHFSSNANDYSSAITGRGTVNIIADNGVSLISGNVSNGKSAGLFVRPDAEINLFAGSSGGTTGTLVINDSISIMSGGNLHINKNNSLGFATDGVIEINDTIKHLDGSINSIFSVNLYNGMLKFGSATVNYDTDGDGLGDGNITSHGSISDKVTFNVYGGKVSTANGEIRNTNLGNLNLFSDALYDLDVDLINEVSDIPTATSFNSNGNDFLIDTIYLFGDTDKAYTEVLVSDGSIDVSLSDETVAAYTTMYRYELGDEKLDSEGVLSFSKDLSTYKGYNPSLYASTITLLAGNMYTNTSSFNKVLSKRTVLPTSFQIKTQPYFSIECLQIQDGYEVENMLFGNIALLHVTPDFSLSFAYAGSQQKYEKTLALQNGGHLSAIYYSNLGSFFINSMINVSGSYSSASTFFGAEHFPLATASFAANLGYTFSLGQHSLSIEPSVLALYSFSKIFDYQNASGFTITVDGVHSTSIIPTVLVTKKITNSIDIFASIKGSFSFLQDIQVMVENQVLPSMSLSPHLEYTVGIKNAIDSSLQMNVSCTGYALSRFGVEFDMSIAYSF